MIAPVIDDATDIGPFTGVSWLQKNITLPVNSRPLSGATVRGKSRLSLSWLR